MSKNNNAVRHHSYLKRIVIGLMLLAVAASSGATESQARWIYKNGKPQKGESVWLRCRLTLDAAPASGFLHVAGDDLQTFYINGRKVYTGGFRTGKISAKNLKAGVNILASKVKNHIGEGGLLVYGELMVNGKKVIVKSDKSWKAMLAAGDDKDWAKTDFDDSKWESAKELRDVTAPHIWKKLIKPTDFMSKEEIEKVTFQGKE